MSDVDEEKNIYITERNARERIRKRVCFEHAVRLACCLIGKEKRMKTHVLLSFCILYARLCVMLKKKEDVKEGETEDDLVSVVRQRFQSINVVFTQ